MFRAHSTWCLAIVSVVIGMTPCAIGAQAQQADGSYERASRGTRVLEGRSGFSIKVLVEQSVLGGAEVEVGEIIFPPGSGASRRGHVHQKVEIFYVLSGVLDHIVNGESHVLTPGMVGIVRPGDEVVHHFPGEVPVKAIVIWAPGGELERIAPNLQERPVNPN